VQPTRYAIRQVLDQELRKEKILQASQLRQARGGGALIGSFVPISDVSENKENTHPTSKAQSQDIKPAKIKRDFFGRPLTNNSLLTPPPEIGAKVDATSIAKSTATKGRARNAAEAGEGEGGRIWMSFHEGFSNAVRKPMTLADLMEGF